MEDTTIGIGMFLAMAVGFIIGLGIAVLYLLTLQKCLNRVSPPNRAMNPALVWLYLIPFFNLVWAFFIVLNIAKSLTAEARTRGIDLGDGGKTIGLVYAIAGACCLVPLVNIVAGWVSVVCWIIYWVKIAGYSNRLAAAPAPAAPPLPSA